MVASIRDIPVSVLSITSEDTIDNIEGHFKISAGPGAGKTKWLVNHIRHVLRKSERLGRSRKISCITFTNVAVETIINRLGSHVERVEVSTIHSFLYKHVIKPFAFLIPDSYGLDIKKLDGHDEIPVYNGMIYDWKSKTNQTYISDENKIVEALKDLAWQFNDHEELILRPRKIYLGKINSKYSIKNDSYIEYKKIYWRNGIIDHDDVLFFSSILINQHSRIIDIIRAKFPYFFIDEFQDTNPLQVYIIKKIAEKETVVGVIGDVAQSIYEFQGAKQEQFENFWLPGIIEYTISENYRSTRKIVEILNSIRSDIKQIAKRNLEGNSPKILVGDKFWALGKAAEITGATVHSLSRTNITSNIIKNRINSGGIKQNLIDELLDKDRNIKRASIVIACIKSIELARNNRYKDALKEISKELKKENEQMDISKFSLNILKKIIVKSDELSNKSLIEFFNYVTSIFPTKISALRAGAAKTFYETNTLMTVSLAVNISEDCSFHRTIHKAKGTEFDNVLLILDKENKAGKFIESEELGFLLAPNLIKDEEHRIRYVAISRARDTLFVNIPSITTENETALISKGFEIYKE